jgi:hypothetical protein
MNDLRSTSFHSASLYWLAQWITEKSGFSRGLRKYSVFTSVLREGHDFSRADKSLQIRMASAAGVACSSAYHRVFRSLPGGQKNLRTPQGSR